MLEPFGHLGYFWFYKFTSQNSSPYFNYTKDQIHFFVKAAKL